MYTRYTPRVLDSVILKLGEKEQPLEDIRSFRESRERYRRLGVPYHRGYLLHGPPGTGKTSLVSALGAKFGMSIYAVNLTELNDRTLKTAINSVPANSIILFEDIDCMKTGNRRPETGDRTAEAITTNVNEKTDPADRFGVTLSGLLNVLDGFHAPENVLFVLTTNKIEALDPALLRPGRIDYKITSCSSGRRRVLRRSSSIAGPFLTPRHTKPATSWSCTSPKRCPSFRGCSYFGAGKRRQDTKTVPSRIRSA
jgi:chaperone BCS1